MTGRVFRWRELFDEHHVRYIERGANVKRGEINIKCPFCGAADPSYHMGVNLESGFWACWRNENHRGKSPLRLIVTLLKVSYYRAREIAGFGDDYIDPEGFSAMAARVLGRDGLLAGGRTVDEDRQHLKFPRDFDTPRRQRGSRVWNYLARERGFGVFTDELIDYYSIKWTQGAEVNEKDPDAWKKKYAWTDRAIIPYYLDHKLMTWTGRTVNGHAIRYKDLSVDESIKPPKQTLFNFDRTIKGGRVLLAVEGPIDALKVDFFGAEVKVRAVAMSTNSMTDEQVYMLADAAERFDRLLFMLDNKTQFGIVDSMKIKAKLSHIPNAGVISVPYGLGDAGALSPKQATEWTDKLSSGEL